MYAIDISEYNGIIDWKIAAPQVELAIVKAVGTNGTMQYLNNVDPLFTRNWSALAARPEILRGAYLFLYMSDNPTVAAQQFLETVKPGPDDLLAVDLEDQVTQAAIKAKGSGSLWSSVITALDVIELATGKKPFIYTSAGWWNYYFCKVAPGKSITPPPWTADYPLWVAHYTLAKTPQLPVGFKNWIIWQFGSEKVPGCGISNGSNPNTDVNRLSLSISDLRAMLNPPAIPITIPPIEIEPTLEQKVAILWKEYKSKAIP